MAVIICLGSEWSPSFDRYSNTEIGAHKLGLNRYRQARHICIGTLAQTMDVKFKQTHLKLDYCQPARILTDFPNLCLSDSEQYSMKIVWNQYTLTTVLRHRIKSHQQRINNYEFFDCVRSNSLCQWSTLQPQSLTSSLHSNALISNNKYTVVRVILMKLTEVPRYTTCYIQNGRCELVISLQRLQYIC